MSRFERRYGFEPVHEPDVLEVRTRSASPIKGFELFSGQAPRLGIAQELLSSEFHLMSREFSTGTREFAAVVEMPVSPIRLEHLLRDLALKPTQKGERVFSPKDIAVFLTSFKDAASVGVRDDDKWGIVKKHADVFANFLPRSGQSFPGFVEAQCLRPEELLEEIISGKFAGYYQSLLRPSEVQDPQAQAFLDRLIAEVRDSDFIWNTNRVPSLAYPGRILGKFVKIGPGSKRDIMKEVVFDLEKHGFDVQGFHARGSHMVELKTPNGEAVYIKNPAGVRAKAMLGVQNAAVIESGNTSSTVKAVDGEDGVKFEILSRESDPSILIPLISWKKDSFGFRHWNLHVVSDMTPALIPLPKIRDWVDHSMYVSSRQFNPLLGLMAIDLLEESVRRFEIDRFGANKLFLNPAFSLFGSVQRKDILLESDFFRRAEQHVASHGK